MKRTVLPSAAAACALLALTACGPAEDRERAAPEATAGTNVLELYVPCAFAPPNAHIVEEFRKRHPEIEVVQQVENVEVLKQRIADGQAADLFMCVGDVEVEELAKANLVTDRDHFCFVGLALVVPEGNPRSIEKLTDLAREDVRTVAIGADETSPGHYARKLLQEAGIWAAVEPKVVAPKFPNQLLRFAGMGKADASIAYAACLRAGRDDWQGQENYQKLSQGVQLVSWLDQGDYCLSIPCAAAIPANAANPKAARLFLDFLRQDTAQKYLTEAGFTALSAPKCF